jgi:hypothetical protein
MKPVNNQTAVSIIRKSLNFAILLLITISQSSCFQHFYQTNTVNKVDTTSLKNLNAENKYFVVHTPDEVFAIKNIKVDSQTISGDRNALNKESENYLNPEVGKPNRYPKKEKATVLSEVHIYTREGVEKKDQVKLVTSQIFRVDIYGSDKKADKDSKVISIIGLTVVPTAAIIVGAVALSNSMNNFGSSWNLNIHE